MYIFIYLQLWIIPSRRKQLNSSTCAAPTSDSLWCSILPCIMCNELPSSLCSSPTWRNIPHALGFYTSNKPPLCLSFLSHPSKQGNNYHLQSADLGLALKMRIRKTSPAAAAWRDNAADETTDEHSPWPVIRAMWAAPTASSPRLGGVCFS